MRVLMSGGGTAGHVYPASTVAERLRAEGHEVTFVGTPNGPEARLVPEAGIPFFPLAARGFDRAAPLSLPVAALVLAASTVRALALVRRVRPDVVLGFGGYVSLPVGFAAALQGVPLVLQEQNSVPGLANKVLSRWASAVATTYAGSAAYLAHPERAVVTGNPVRPALRAADRARGREAFGLGADDLVLLVFGGSRGARHLNEATIALYPRLVAVPRLRVLHLTGRIEFPAVAERLAAIAGPEPGGYRLLEYVDDMASALAAADLVVARAGATSIAEITTVGRASVLVPFPYATDDHQTLNARAVADAGGAVLVSDAELDGPVFGDAVLGLLSDEERRDGMAAASRALGRPDAAERVEAVALEAAGTVRRADGGRG